MITTATCDGLQSKFIYVFGDCVSEVLVLIDLPDIQEVFRRSEVVEFNSQAGGRFAAAGSLRQQQNKNRDSEARVHLAIILVLPGIRL
jgi:hypothetical protein